MVILQSLLEDFAEESIVCRHMSGHFRQVWQTSEYEGHKRSSISFVDIGHDPPFRIIDSSELKCLVYQIQFFCWNIDMKVRLETCLKTPVSNI